MIMKYFFQSFFDLPHKFSKVSKHFEIKENILTDDVTSKKHEFFSDIVMLY